MTDEVRLNWAIEYRPKDGLGKALIESLGIKPAEWFVVGRSPGNELVLERHYDTRAKAEKALTKVGAIDVADLEANWASTVWKHGP